jgi:hypothetical protein
MACCFVSEAFLYPSLGRSGRCHCRPKGGVLQSYTKCSRPEYKPNSHVKTLGNTAHVAGAAWSPHHLDYQAGYYAGEHSDKWVGLRGQVNREAGFEGWQQRMHGMES